jgi:hypothetical protein
MSDLHIQAANITEAVAFTKSKYFQTINATTIPDDPYPHLEKLYILSVCKRNSTVKAA